MSTRIQPDLLEKIRASDTRLSCRATTCDLKKSPPCSKLSQETLERIRRDGQSAGRNRGPNARRRDSGGNGDPSEGMIITLQPDEVQVCQMVGRMRSLIARGNGCVMRRWATRRSGSGCYGDDGGVWICEEDERFPDLGLTPRSGSADGVMASGKRYDAKASRHKTARLLSTLKVNPDADATSFAWSMARPSTSKDGHSRRNLFSIGTRPTWDMG